MGGGNDSWSVTTIFTVEGKLFTELRTQSYKSELCIPVGPKQGVAAETEIKAASRRHEAKFAGFISMSYWIEKGDEINAT